MLDYAAIASATTMPQVLAQLPKSQPDRVTHVIIAHHIGGGQYTASEPLAVNAVYPQAKEGTIEVQTLSGNQVVKRFDLLAQCAYCGARHYGEAENWSPLAAGNGGGYHATHAQALAALPQLGAAALKARNQGRR